MTEQYPIEELKKYFDPIIFNNLDLLTISEIKYRRLTIVFWDIAGFSVLCNDLVKNQSAIIAFLKEYFSSAIEIISKYKGVLDKFMGDGIMAYFGYPVENEDHPALAIHAALDLRDNFQEIKIRYQHRWLKHFGKKITIDLKCGIHSGFAHSGLLASTDRNQITVIGGDVNMASRLEEFATNDQIIISKDLKNMVEDQFEFKEVLITSRKKIKSFEKMREVYLVLDRKKVK